MISIDFSGNIRLFNTKGAYATLENIEDAEIFARLDELVNKYAQLLIASEGATWSVTFTAQMFSPSDLSDLLNSIMVETDGKTYINVIDDGAPGAFCMQTLSMTEENVRAALMSALTNAHLRRKAYLDFLKNEREARS